MIKSSGKELLTKKNTNENAITSKGVISALYSRAL